MSDSVSVAAGLGGSGFQPAYVIDLPGLEVGTKLAMTGQVIWRREFTHHFVLGVRDMTGTVVVRLTTAQQNLPGVEKVHSRVRIFGALALNHQGQRIIDNIEETEDLGGLNMPYSQLNAELREQASRMLLSRVTYIAASILRDEHFIEFDSKVISTEWVEGGLEPLRVLYPGFGNPATLATSPSAQVMDFLNTTGARKAFTVSTCFTTTYRHAQNAAETRVVVAKGIGLKLDDLHLVTWRLANRILERLTVEGEWQPSPVVRKRAWADKTLQPKEVCRVNMFQYSSDIVTGGIGWRNTSLEQVIHVTDAKSNILIDASFEKIGEHVISGITLFPSQFLTYLETTPPMRQLRNLGSYHDWLQ